MPERSQALIQDLATMGDEEQSRPTKTRAQALVVQGCHDRLTRAGRRDQQVSMVALQAGQLDQLEQPGLERLRTDLNRTQVHPGATSPSLGQLLELSGIEVAEVVLLPVALENGRELVDN